MLEFNMISLSFIVVMLILSVLVGILLYFIDTGVSDDVSESPYEEI